MQKAPVRGSSSINEVFGAVSFLKCDLNEDLEHQCTACWWNRLHGCRVATESGREGVEGRVSACRWVVC